MKRLIWLFAVSIFSPNCFATEIDFDKQIRPILSDNCFHCHGPDEATRQADLRLDTLKGSFADLGGYAAFVAHQPGSSEALQRVLTDDPDEQMPPPDSKLKLSDSQKRLLHDWVQSGARWSEHWSFVPPREPNLPVDRSPWVKNEIDNFILRRARQAGLQPQPDADRQTLIRRASLDLTGLPPTPNQVDTFLADQSDDAYENLIDRLIASPRYGERMAWDWLDAARYADTDGFQGIPHGQCGHGAIGWWVP